MFSLELTYRFLGQVAIVARDRSAIEIQCRKILLQSLNQIAFHALPEQCNGA